MSNATKVMEAELKLQEAKDQDAPAPEIAMLEEDLAVVSEEFKRHPND